MDRKEILDKEIERLRRLNDLYERKIEDGVYKDEPKHIVDNILTMCEIVKVY